LSAKASGSAQKRNRQNEKRRIANRMYTTKVKNSTKKILGLIEEKNKEKAAGEFKEFSAFVDKAVKKGLFHKNKAARRKSRMQKKINSLA
jgi:small subunit ribosomal protein S20